MKTLIHASLALLAITATTFAAGGHDKVIPGPRGGKIVEVEGGHAEFFVQPDKKVSITFYGEDMKPVTPSEQNITIIAEASSGKAKLGFEKTGDAFVSTTTLPEGEGYRVVLQIKATADAKLQNIRIDYHTEVCGKCNRAEYACICAAEGGGGHEGHGH